MSTLREKILVGERRKKYVENQLVNGKMSRISKGFARLEVEYHRAALMALRYHAGDNISTNGLEKELHRAPEAGPEIEKARVIMELDQEDERNGER